MDIGLPNNSGIQVVAELKANRPEVQYMMCTIYDDEEKIFNALCVGATGYLLKNTSATEMAKAVKTVYNGGIHDVSEYGKKSGAVFSKPEDRVQRIGKFNGSPVGDHKLPGPRVPV
jgi:DNA-binding NarL/FixJ family response regulator